MKVFYDFALTRALRIVTSYQHFWNLLTARGGGKTGKRGHIPASLGRNFVGAHGSNSTSEAHMDGEPADDGKALLSIGT